MQKLIQTRHLFRILSGSTPESGQALYWDGYIPWVTPEDLSSLTDGYVLNDTKRKITEAGYENSGVRLVPKKSIVLTKRAPIGLLAILGVEACSNQGCFLLVPTKEVWPEYYYYYFFAKKEELQILGRGSTFMELSLDDIKSFKSPLISLKEQKAIAKYLDDETRKIDSLIKSKEKLLTLLAEKKQALITRAVTKGINPNAHMKDSGIDWLGEIPEHWKVKKLKYVTTKIGSGVTPKGGAEVYQNEGIPLLRSQNVHFDGLRLDDVVFISEDIHENMSNSKVQKGDVLINITGASIGRCYFWEGQYDEANVNQHVCILRPNDSILSEYLTMLLSCDVGQNQVAVNQVGGGREGLTFESLKSFDLPLPQKGEQREIIKNVRAELNRLTSLEGFTKRSIELLKERRAALIAAAVTGEVDVN